MRPFRRAAVRIPPETVILSPGMLNRTRVRARSTCPRAIFQFTGELAVVSSVVESVRAIATSASERRAVFTVTISCGISIPWEFTKKRPMLPLISTPAIMDLVLTAARVSSMPSTSISPCSRDAKLKSTLRRSTSSRLSSCPSFICTSCKSISKRKVNRSRPICTFIPVVSDR